MNIKKKWNINTLQNYITTQNKYAGYTVLEFSYNYLKDNVLYVLLKCPNESHPTYWIQWNSIRSLRCCCKQCYYDQHNKNSIKAPTPYYINLFKSHGLVIIDTNKIESVKQKILCTDTLGFKIITNIKSLTNGTKATPFKCNKYAIENINLYCDLFRSDYKFLSTEYKNSNIQYKWEYIGNDLPTHIDPTFYTSLTRFIRLQKRHPFFTTPKGESYIETYLQKHNLVYVKQFSIPECKHKRALRFDFAVFNDDKLTLLEFQGRQHYELVEYFGGNGKFQDDQIRDEIKRTYCSSNNISLVEIPYWNFKSIEDILTTTFFS